MFTGNRQVSDAHNAQSEFIAMRKVNDLIGGSFRLAKVRTQRVAIVRSEIMG